MGEGEAGKSQTRERLLCSCRAAVGRCAVFLAAVGRCAPPPAAPKIFKTYGIRNRESVKLMLISADLQIPYSHNQIHTAIISRNDLLQ